MEIRKREDEIVLLLSKRVYIRLRTTSGKHIHSATAIFRHRNASMAIDFQGAILHEGFFYMRNREYGVYIRIPEDLSDAYIEIYRLWYFPVDTNVVNLNLGFKVTWTFKTEPTFLNAFDVVVLAAPVKATVSHNIVSKLLRRHKKLYTFIFTEEPPLKFHSVFVGPRQYGTAYKIEWPQSFPREHTARYVRLQNNVLKFGKRNPEYYLIKPEKIEPTKLQRFVVKERLPQNVLVFEKL